MDVAAIAARVATLDTRSPPRRRPIALGPVYLLIIENIAKFGILVLMPQDITKLPIWSLSAVNIVIPIAYSVLLIERRIVGADIRDTASIFVAHVENLTVMFLVGVKTDSTVVAVKCESQIRNFFPPFGLKEVESHPVCAIDLWSLAQSFSMPRIQSRAGGDTFRQGPLELRGVGDLFLARHRAQTRLEDRLHFLSLICQFGRTKRRDFHRTRPPDDESLVFLVPQYENHQSLVIQQ
ncbi:unnamed protein product [Nesidiocoris tenuis]|uniref:Uncharacterized protein n=1 Tax=Nesidiocoris tenuis TaxID=355587 RepID=A0A6H5GLX5_9HEMI|nr:unnamed protein product [Nesidiocoris tenuis]